MFIRIFNILIILFYIFKCVTGYASHFPLQTKNDDLFGKMRIEVASGEDFATIARRYDLGFYELVEANPEVNPNHVPVGTVLIIPTRFVLPRVQHKGVVINLAAMRLYYFPEGKSYFYTFPVGIGKENWQTPLGVLSIIEKIEDPIWHVPKSIQQYREKHHDPVPAVIQAGPDNPLGKFALRLSKPRYLIHGTNDPESVGRRSSAGCIHLYPEDIKLLYQIIPLNTQVVIINEPYIVGLVNHGIYIEAHLPLAEQRKALTQYTNNIKDLINTVASNQNVDVNWKGAEKVLKQHLGLPALVGYDQAD